MTVTAQIPVNRFGPVGKIMAAMMFFALQDITVKYVVSDTSLWQLQMIRSVATLALLVTVVALLNQGARLAPQRWGWALLRALFMSGAYLFFYASLTVLPVTTAAATFFTGPLLITLLAALILREPIGPRRIVAVIVGFVGVLVIIRPGAGAFSVFSILPLVSALCYASGTVLTRWRCKEEANFALSMVHNLLYAIIGMAGVLVLPILPLSGEARETFPFLATGWHELSAIVILLMLATAGTHLVGVLLTVRAYQEEDASRLAPFEYSYLALLPLLEYAIWGIWPALTTLVGIVLIAGAGMFVAWREGRPPRPRAHTHGETPWTPETQDGKHGG